MTYLVQVVTRETREQIHSSYCNLLSIYREQWNFKRLTLKMMVKNVYRPDPGLSVTGYVLNRLLPDYQHHVVIDCLFSASVMVYAREYGLVSALSFYRKSALQY